MDYKRKCKNVNWAYPRNWTMSLFVLYYVIATIRNSENWQVSMSCENRFIEALRQRGCRLTPQREIVLRVLHEIEGLATAEEIYQCVQAVSAAIDISTVYRTLDLLQEFGLVAAVNIEGSQNSYELLGVHGPHAHLICYQCGAVVGVPLDEVQLWLAQLKEQYGFVVDLAQLTLPGLCAQCASQSGTNPDT